MAKYAYPAIFSLEDDGGYTVSFPDVDGCFTFGDTLAEAIFMAEDALALMLYNLECNSSPLPTPSNPSAITTTANEFINYISCDTIIYRKRFNNRAVKKTLSIPEWINEAAMALNLNFSQVLQEALLKKIKESNTL